LADPDGDGIGNLLEYALGLDPLTAGLAGLPVLGQTNGCLALTYTTVNRATDITYRPEVSADLITWTNGAAYVTETVLASNTLTQTIQAHDLFPSAAAVCRFMRLRVTRP
jgi:hypothetical protein